MATRPLRRLLLDRFLLALLVFSLASTGVVFLTPRPTREVAELYLLRDGYRAAANLRSHGPSARLTSQQPSPTDLFLVQNGQVLGPRPKRSRQLAELPPQQVRDLFVWPPSMGARWLLPGGVELWAEARRPAGLYQVSGNPAADLRWWLGLGVLLLTMSAFGLQLTRQVEGQLRALGEASSRLAAGDFSAALPTQDPTELGLVAHSLADMAQQVRRREEQLLASSHQLQAATEERSRLLATVSHELRSPLTSILGTCQVLLDGLAGPLDPEHAAPLAAITREGRRLLTRVNRLLELGRAEAGWPDLLVSEVFLNECLEEAFEEVQSELEGVQVERQLPPRSPVVRGDHQALRLVLSSLLLESAGGKELRLVVQGPDSQGEVRLRLQGTQQPGLLGPETGPQLLARMQASCRRDSQGLEIFLREARP